MTAGNDARHWHEIAQHLVQAHRAYPDALISYAPTLEQLHFAHADTHETLASNGEATTAVPDGHAHAEPLDPGYPYIRDSSFRLFPPGPNASCRMGGPYFAWESCLPQTFWEAGVPPAYQEAFEAQEALEAQEAYEAALSGTDPDGPELEADQ